MDMNCTNFLAGTGNDACAERTGVFASQWLSQSEFQAVAEQAEEQSRPLRRVYFDSLANVARITRTSGKVRINAIACLTGPSRDPG
jgi:hypothetical protein